MPPVPDTQCPNINQSPAAATPNPAVGFQGPEFIAVKIVKTIMPVAGVLVVVPVT